MAREPQKDWSAEFRELGADRVRSTLVSGQWDREKRAAARVWIETADARAWQEKRSDKDGSAPGSFMLRLRSAKWWRYAAPAVMALMGIGLLLRRLH